MVIKVNNLIIGKGRPCFIIAEIGVNHILEPVDMQKSGFKSSLDVAFKMIDVAKAAGVSAVKFQAITTDKLQFKGTKKPKYQVNNVGSDEKVSYYDMLRRLETSPEDQLKISAYCKKKSVLFFSTPYSPDDADFLNNKLKVPLFKLPSIDLNNHLMIRHIMKFGKPLILSTGLSEASDVEEIISIAQREGFADRLVLLQCTSDYPTFSKDINLNVLKNYMKKYPDLLFGFSDHSETDTASIGAVAIGATVVEKHFTLNKSFKGPDHSSSLNPDELCFWVSRIRELEESMGSFEKRVTEVEKRNITMRKYLVISPNSARTVITEKMLSTLRTGGGILPVDKNLKKVVGKKLLRDVKESSVLTWDMIDK